MSAELIVSHLRKQFAVGRPAVDDVSFRVAAGEIVVLLGPSGCGKTTTLRCIAGLEQPTAGMISIGGDEVAAPERGLHVPPRLRNIGMVFQSYAVWPHMTVRQNVNYPLRHRKIPRDQAAHKVNEVLSVVGLSEYAERHRFGLVVGDVERGDAGGFQDAAEVVAQPHPQLGVEVGQRLVEQDQVRAIDHAAGERDALHLAARQ